MTRKVINLALQGGGAHGAYSWGALDRLLQEKDLHIEGISGTSAGAMNAAVMAMGYIDGERDGARAALLQFWRRISEISAFSPFHKNPLMRMLTGWNLDASPAYHYFDMLSRLLSPYDLNPLNINPLRIVLSEMLDMDKLHRHSAMKLFITATHVESGQARVFKRHEVTIDVLLASACIPFLFQAVEVEGEHYWDGGYMGNPAIWPLIYNCQSEDVMLIQINPIHRPALPRTANEIINRLNEISFNSSLIAEMRAIAFVKKLLDAGRLSRDEYKDMKIHLIYSPEEMRNLNASSKMNAGWDFFMHLHDMGYAAAEDWLHANYDKIGKHSTVDIHDKFLCGVSHTPDAAELGKHHRKHKEKQESGNP